MLIGALQSSYLPWLGYFEQIARADLFVIYDDLQYTRKDWRNRNRIKTPNGPMWLTVPVQAPHRQRPTIREMLIAGSEQWAARHWRALFHNYTRAPWFHLYAPHFRWLYQRRWKRLAELNRHLLDYCLQALDIRTLVQHSSALGLEQEFFSRHQHPDATDRIVFLCRHFGADSFLEGASGRDYIDHHKIQEAGIDLQYQDYAHPHYRQLFGDFIPYLSIVDLLFNEGEQSLEILRSGGGQT